MTGVEKLATAEKYGEEIMPDCAEKLWKQQQEQQEERRYNFPALITKELLDCWKYIQIK